MLSAEQLDIYRRMAPGERLRLTFDMIEENAPYLLRGPLEMVDRRFALIKRENDLRNEALLAAFARLRQKESAREGNP
jgi:hypothetical protein